MTELEKMIQRWRRDELKLKRENEKLKDALRLLITEIDVIEMTEDTPISEEAYSKAVKLLTK